MNRCAAAHQEDRSACEGPHDAVRVVDATGGNTHGCVLHGAVLLNTLHRGRVYPGSVDGAAIRAYVLAQALRPGEFGYEALARGVPIPPADQPGSGAGDAR